MLLYLSSGVLVMGEVVTVGGDGLSVRGVSAFDGGERGDGAFEGVGGLGEGEVGGFAQGTELGGVQGLGWVRDQVVDLAGYGALEASDDLLGGPPSVPTLSKTPGQSGSVS